MRRFHLTLLAGALPMLVLSLALVGCGGKKDDDDDDAPVRKKGGTQAKVTTKKQLKPVKATEYGTITGKVVWAGGKPNEGELTAQLQKTIEQNRDYCLSAEAKDHEKNQQVYRIGDNGNLGNVFVWIQPEPGHYFEVPEDQIKTLPKEVLISQPHCAFLPHCSVHTPVYNKDGQLTPTGQKLIVENDAKVTHNAKVGGTAENPVLDRLIGPGGKEQYNLKPDRAYITVACGIHPWMRGYIRTFDHPYAAVSSVGGNLEKKVYEDLKDAKFGTYEIKGVPVGAKVRIYAWHESESVGDKGDKGWLTSPQGEEITIQKATTKDFTAKLK